MANRNLPDDAPATEIVSPVPVPSVRDGVRRGSGSDRRPVGLRDGPVGMGQVEHPPQPEPRVLGRRALALGPLGQQDFPRRPSKRRRTGQHSQYTPRPAVERGPVLGAGSHPGEAVGGTGTVPVGAGRGDRGVAAHKGTGGGGDEPARPLPPSLSRRSPRSCPRTRPASSSPWKRLSGTATSSTRPTCSTSNG